MTNDSKKLRSDLKRIGIAEDAINAVWPDWWGDDAESSRSAQAELRFSVARKLGLSPRSLFESDTPTFVWRHNAKFKGLTATEDAEKAAITSFSIALARLLLRATPNQARAHLVGMAAEELRSKILVSQPVVSLVDLTALCWGLGVPLLHLRIFPLSAKRMHAMAVRVDNHYAILLAKDSQYPAPSAYHVAHELGHIACGHLAEMSAVIDLDEPIEAAQRDAEENEADRFALTLLTGHSEPKITTNMPATTGRQLANAAMSVSKDTSIEAGTIALCYGHQSSDWNVAYSALRYIYDKPAEVWVFINKLARQELDWSVLSDENASYVQAILGGPHFA